MSVLDPLTEGQRLQSPARRAGLGRFGDWARAHPLAFWTVVSLALGALSCAIWDPVPGFDVESWINWGWAASHPVRGGFKINGGPSWKPLPVVFTSFYGLFGHAAPTLWMITARAGGILGLAGVFRLSFELTSRAGLPRWSGWVAGVVGCAGLILTAPNIDANWVHNFFRGTVEPGMIAAWLWAIDAMLRRRHLLAYTLVAVEGLMRPEAWLFLFAYGVWLWFKQPRLRVWVVVCLVAQPTAWFLPPGLSTGHPFMAATNAHSFNGRLGQNWLRTVLRRADHLQPLPTLVFAAIASLAALWRQRGHLAVWRARDRQALLASRESLALSLAALSFAWFLVVVLETGAGYPGLQRFFFPATATVCVLSGLGFVEVVAFAGRLAGRVFGAGRGPGTAATARRGSLLAGIGVAAALAAISYPYISTRIAFARVQKTQVAIEQAQMHELGVAIAALGGARALLPCGGSVVDINNTFKPQLAWEMDVAMNRVRVLRSPGVVFLTRPTTFDGRMQPFGPGLRYRHYLGRWGDWSVYQVYRNGPKPGCIGD